MVGIGAGGGDTSPLGSSYFVESSFVDSVGTTNSLSSPYKSTHYVRNLSNICNKRHTAIKICVEVRHRDGGGQKKRKDQADSLPFTSSYVLFVFCTNLEADPNEYARVQLLL